MSAAPSSLPLTPAPFWARTLLAAVCARYHVSSPTLRFRPLVDYPNAVWASIGDYSPKTLTITIYAAQDHLLERMTLLHEIAHHLVFVRTGRDDHSTLFWRYCWTLYRTYRIPLHAAVLSEFAYMARAEQVLLTMGVRFSPQATAAAHLGRALRADSLLQDRIRHLRARLLRLRSPRTRSLARRSLRTLTQRQATTSRAQTRHALAYKRVAKPRHSSP
jgi:hypothetical protein